MTFFTKYGPAPCDKKCCSDHQTLFLHFGEGLGMRLVAIQYLLLELQAKFHINATAALHVHHKWKFQ